MLSEQQVERYSRQIILPQVGGRGQEALLAASVTMYGSAEMATTAGLYLAGAGVGHLYVSPPVAAALDGVNPDCHVALLMNDPVTDIARAPFVLCAGAGVEISARVHAASHAAGMPVIVGDATGTVGWMGVRGSTDAACYACLAPPLAGAGRADDTLGELTAGFIGTLLAGETLKAVLGLPLNLQGCRLLFDALGGDIHVEAARRDPQCPVCGGRS